MSLSNVGSTPWYTQNSYQPRKGGMEDLRKQFMGLEKSLQESDLAGARKAMEELRKTAPGKDAGSDTFQALGKALDKGDLALAKTTFAQMLEAGADKTKQTQKATTAPSEAIVAPRPTAQNAGIGLDLYA